MWKIIRTHTLEPGRELAPRKINKLKTHFSKWADVRKQVFERDGYTCRKCGDKCSRPERWTGQGEIRTDKRVALTVDHVIQQSAGGTSEMSNLQTLCKICHGHKDNQTAPSGMNRRNRRQLMAEYWRELERKTEIEKNKMAYGQAV